MKDINSCFKVLHNIDPQLSESIAVKWGNLTFRAFTSGLIHSGNLPLEAIEAIMALQEIHEHSIE